MDLGLFFDVLWRHRRLVVAGFVVAALLASLTYVKIGTDGSFSYRQNETWESAVTLQVTQLGFPEGRVVVDSEGDAEPASGPEFADPGRLVGLAELYARLVNSDPVRATLRAENLDDTTKGPRASKVRTRVVETSGGDPLPLIEIVGIASSRDIARLRSKRQSEAFKAHIAKQQIANNIPVDERVRLDVVDGPTKPKVVAPRSKTLPILVFLSALIATIALAFALENLRKRPSAAAAGVGEDVDEGELDSLPEPAALPGLEQRQAAAGASGRRRGLRSTQRNRSSSDPS